MISFTAPALTAPDACIVGILADDVWPVAPETAVIGIDEPLPESPRNAILEFPLAKVNAVARAQGISRLLELRRAGATLVLLTHDEQLLEACADEIWWIRGGHLVERGDPGDVLARYRQAVAARLRVAGVNQSPALSPSLRNGDGRAQLQSVELIGEDGLPAAVWKSGEDVVVRVTVRFASEIQEPVIGMLIRTRIGLNVYGTNTELEGLHFGPVKAGESVCVTYHFRCDLCPGDYTITVASHDPDGVWHDWLEDAVAFAVADSRYTAGVANLRARVTAQVTS